MASPKELEKELEASRARNKSMRQRMEAATEEGVGIALMLGTTFVASAAMEKYRDDKGDVPSVGGVPADAIVGAGLLLLDVLEVGGDASLYLGAIGEGAAASFAARAGTRMGKDSREKSGKKVSGEPRQLGPGAPAYGQDAFSQFVNSAGGMVPR